MAAPGVLAILVAHASRTRVVETLRSLGAQTYAEIEIVVAAIGDFTVPEDGASATVVPVREGAGFGEAVTHVLTRVRAEGFAYVLLLHDDVSLEPSAIEHMVHTAQSDPAIAAVGAKLLEWYEPEVLQEVGAAIDRFAIRRSALDAGEVDAGQRDESSDVLFCSDACLLVRRDALIDVGGMDAKAWPFYEDVDLCWRLRATGARVVVDPRARARHAADLSRGRRLFESMALREHAEHGRLRFMLKHYAVLGLIVLFPQVFVAAILRIVVALFRRELWRVRVTVGAWMRLVRELPGILGERRGAPKAHVEDRELLALAARGAVGDVRGDRAEWASRLGSYVARAGERALVLARQPVTWATVAALAVVGLVLRDVLLGGTFALGELRPLAPFGDVISDHFAEVRREGLDPFGPAGPGAVVLGLIRSIVVRGSLAEKLALLLPLWFAGVAGARVGRALGFEHVPRRWLGVAAAVNPVTLILLRDGAFGALAMWAASLWLVAQLLAPVQTLEGAQAQVRFLARWAFGWAITVALHPPALPWLIVLGVVVILARRGDERSPRATRDRVRILVAGTLGAFVLLLPWSLQWLTLRSPLVGRPGWLVNAVDGGLATASLGGGWPFLAWLALAVIAAFYVGLDRTAFAFITLAGLAVIAGATGALPRETMLAGAGVCAFVVVAIAARHIAEAITRYEFGRRQAAAITGVVALGALWIGGVVETVPDGARTRDVPVIAGVRASETGRVLWLAETTGGVRSWSTLSFSERLGAFPPPSGPEERLVTKAVEAARGGRMHRLGGVLALADISHVIALDAEARVGLGSQSDLAPQEEQGTATVFRNDAWQGPALRLAAAPDDPLTPSGLADVVRRQQKVDLSGWPYGPITLRPAIEEAGPAAVVYVAGGARGGLEIEGADARIAAAGVYVPATDVRGTVDVEAPGRWWRWLLPVQALIVVALLGAWISAAYIGSPIAPASDTAPELRPFSSLRPLLAAAPMLLVLGAVLGWTGVAWGVGTPFLSSAWYCPPVGSGYDQRIAIVNPSPRSVAYVVRPELGEVADRSSRIGAHARHTLPIASHRGAVVESYGRRLVVGTEVTRQGDSDATLCASDTRTANIFPEGGRAATLAVPRLFERYVLYNPFPDLARASVRFVSPDEPISPPALQDVRIPPGEVVEVNPEEQFEPMLDLSTIVRVWQGRAIVARRLRTTEQVSFSLPVDEVQEGVLPRASTAGAATNLIGVNLGEDPAHVTVFGAGRTGSLPEETFDVDAESRGDFELEDLAPSTRDLVVGIESDAPVALESLVAPDDRAAVSLMPPQQPARRWVIPFGERRELLIINPNTRTVRVRIERLGRGDEIRDVSLAANRVTHIQVSGTAPFGILVESTGGGVTAAAIGSRGSMPGVPLP